MTKHAIGISNEKLENSSHKKITTGRLRDLWGSARLPISTRKSRSFFFCIKIKDYKSFKSLFLLHCTPLVHREWRSFLKLTLIEK